MAIRLLESISSVQVGDYVPMRDHSFTHGVGIVDEVKENNFSYTYGTSLSIVRKEELPGMILLRKTPEGLEILAGSRTYAELTR
jgi:hypothetical protein